MKTIINNIKNYFTQKDKGESIATPIGMCILCWGHSEWDGEYYELKRDKHLTPGSDIYESFISKIADKHVKSTHKHENKYICTTCNNEI